MSRRKSATTAIAAIISIGLAIGNWLGNDERSESAPPAVAGTSSVAEPSPVSETGTGSEASERIRVSDLTALREHVDQDVVVYGSVRRTSKSGSGHQFLNFPDTEFSVICRQEDVKKFPKGGPAELFEGKDVEVAGRLETYRGKMQICVRGPEQIQIVQRGRAPPNATVELKEVRDNVWVSPAGLVYRGYDPEGLTRVAHIERHTRDIPDRDGPHGVFDGGKAVAFGVIDEAWERAQQQKQKPRIEGDRSVYDVTLGRRVGFLGGRAGARRRHPPLKRVRIVFESETKNIVTAFPR